MKTLGAFALAVILLVTAARAIDLPAELQGSIPYEVQQLDREELVTGGGRLLWDRMIALLGTTIGKEMRSMVLLLLVPLLCGMASGFSAVDTFVARYIDVLGVSAIVMLSADELTGLIGLGVNAMDELRTLSNALLPTMAAALAMGGSVGSASVLQVGTLLSSDLLLRAIHELLLPMTYCYIGVAAAAAILPESHLDTLAGGIKKLVTAALCAMMLAFTLYLTFGNIMSGSVDRVAVKTAKTAMSAAIPVVGGILSEAAETVLTGATAVRSVCGVAGVLAVLLVSLSPLVSLGVRYVLYRVVAALASVSGAKALDAFIRDLGSAFGLVLGMTGACTLLLLVSLLLSITMVVV